MELWLCANNNKTTRKRPPVGVHGPAMFGTRQARRLLTTKEQETSC
jgi:hypothetical protein